MLEVLDQTSEKAVDQVPESQQWKKRTVWGAFTLFILIPFIARWVGIQNIDSLFVIDFLFFFSFAMYGKVTGKLEVREHCAQCQRESDAYLPGYNAFGDRDLFRD